MTGKNTSNAMVLDRLFDSLAETPKTEKELDAALTESGIDVESLVTNGVKEIGKLKATLRLQFAAERKDILKKAREQLREFSHQVDKPIEALMELFSTQKQPELQSFFSKVKSLDVDEALEMLDEATLLDLIEKIENQQDEEG